MLGLAVAGVMVSATTLIADYYSGPARAAFMGLQAGFMGLGGVVFLTLGGALAQQNWHYPFGIYLFAWPIALLVLAFIVEPNRSNSHQPNMELDTDLTSQSTPVGVMVIMYGLTTLSQIAFYLIPVQLPFYLDSLVKANPSQSGVAIALCTLFSAITSGRLRQRICYLGLSTAMFLGQFLSPIVTQPLTKSMGLGGTYAIVGGGLVIVALGFAIFKSQVRDLTRSLAN